METEIIKIKDCQNNIFEKLKNYYLSEKIIAIPTETVYGLSADATNFEAVSKIFSAKGRPSDNPLIVHFAKLEQLEGIVDFSEKNVTKLVEKFWPGPMTLILPLQNKEKIASNVTAGLDTLAVRMPKNETAFKILQETGILLAAPSANTSGKPSPTSYDHVFNDMNGKIDVIIKDENSSIGLESTVIDCTKFPFVIARPGSISKRDIEEVLGENSVKYTDEKNSLKPISPGMKYRHYSPEGELIISSETLPSLLEFLKDKNNEYGLITYRKYNNLVNKLNINVKYLADSEENIEQSNKNLYNILREFDKEKVKKIFMLPIQENDLSKALVNRIEKASSKK